MIVPWGRAVLDGRPALSEVPAEALSVGAAGVGECCPLETAPVGRASSAARRAASGTGWHASGLVNWNSARASW
jgi:hypothetical protein